MNNLELTNQMLALLKDEQHKLEEGLARIDIQIASLEDYKQKVEVKDE